MFFFTFRRFSASGVQNHQKRLEKVHVENVLQKVRKFPCCFFRILFLFYCFFGRFSVCRKNQKQNKYLSKNMGSSKTKQIFVEKPPKTSPKKAPPPPVPPLPQFPVHIVILDIV
jgi:hypothetical protein